MADNNAVLRITVDDSDLRAAVGLILLRRNTGPAERRLEIDRVLLAIERREIPHDRVTSVRQEEIGPGRQVFYISAGPVLLDLALPLAEVTS